MAYGMHTMGPESIPGSPHYKPPQQQPQQPQRPAWAPGTGPMPPNAPPGFNPSTQFMIGDKVYNVADFGDAVQSAWGNTLASGGNPYTDQTQVGNFRATSSASPGAGVPSVTGNQQPSYGLPPYQGLPAPGGTPAPMPKPPGKAQGGGAFGGGSFGFGGASSTRGVPSFGAGFGASPQPILYGSNNPRDSGGSTGGATGGAGPRVDGISTVNTSINPTTIYTPQMTQEAVNQARASQLGMGDAAWLRTQAAGGGRGLNSGSVMQSAMQPIAQGLAASARAGSQIPMQDAIANAQHLLAGQRGRDSEFFGLAGIPMQQQGQQNDLLMQLLSMFGGMLGG